MSRAKGNAGEDAAVRFLEMNGYAILARNYAIRGAEVDVIARQGDVIAFIEVKTRSSLQYAAPREAVSRGKQRRIAMAAMRWLQENAMPEANVRFDIVEITPQGPVLLRGAFGYIE